MRLRGLALSLLIFLGFVAGLNAQGQVPTPPSQCTSNATAILTCPQGLAFYFDLGQVYDPLEAVFGELNGLDGIFFDFSFAVTAGSLPPGLTLSPNGVFSGTLTTAGQFNFTLTLTIKLGAEGMTIFSDSVGSPATFVVTPYSGPTLTIAPSALSFSLTQGAAGVTKSVNISNNSNEALQYSASVTTNSGGNWLQLTSSGGSIAPFNSSSLGVTADPSSLKPGTYSGTVTISVAGGQTLTVSVLVVVAGTQPAIVLSQTGLRFEAVLGGAATSPQTITVLNPGSGTLNFSASAATVSGGNWLSVSPSSGSSSASAAGEVTASVNPAGLQAGDYYGTITVSASGAVNSPQVVSVVLNVVTPANSPGAFVQPTGMIFVGSAGGTNPAAKTLTITNLSPDALTYLATPFSNNSSSWLTATPASGSVSATQPASVSVQPVLQGLAPGIYIGDLSLNIASPSATAATATSQILHVEVLLVVLPAGTTLPSQLAPRPHAAGCTPGKLLPVFTLLGTGFTAAVAWPTAIEVTVVDDCGIPLVSGSVTTSFTSGDPALALDSLGDGRWTGTWNATHAASGVTITAQAQEVTPALTGSSSIGGTLQPNTGAPAVSSGGVVSAANFTANQPLAPGSFGAIFGSNLSAGLNVSAQLPLSLELGNTSVVLAGEQLPLLFTSGNQINVVLPYDVPVNTTQQILVQNGSAISIPQAVVIAPAQPAVFTQNGFGTGAALISVYQSDGTALPNNSAVTAGDVIVLYCSGLGAVNPPVAAGSQAPSSPLSYTVNPATVTIGQMSAPVLFSGLAPSFAQLYQVNVQIPAGLPSGSAVLTVSVGGQQSAPVTITVQ
jgi:uncharacterized protein (TIGR03437 family)